MLDLMTEKLAKRKQRETRAIKGLETGEQEVSDTELFSMLGDQIKVVKQND